MIYFLFLLLGSGVQKYLPSSRLCHAVTASLQYTEGTLVSHPDKTPQSQLEYHASLEGHKVSHIFQ